ncbi:MAG: hypothetical protein AAGA66_06345 [Bacteroidota bacterium]
MSENLQYLAFLEKWQDIVFILVFVALSLGILNYLFFNIKFATRKTLKQKFDFASKQQVKYLFRSHLFIAAALFLFVNTISEETMEINITWFLIRFFVAFCAGFLYGYVTQLILKFYYPSKLEKRLKKLRYSPRINPENGNKMKLLSEEDEDAYLDEGMQAEENVFSVDYDVWIDAETGYTQIEKYKGHLSALECDRCGFQTLRLEKEEVIKRSTEFEDGELLKEYHCSYCGRIRRKNVILSHKIKDGSEVAAVMESPVGNEGRIAVVKIEIHGTRGEIKEYDFQNIEHATHFLEEFDFEKLEEESI